MTDKPDFIKDAPDGVDDFMIVPRSVQDDWSYGDSLSFRSTVSPRMNFPLPEGAIAYSDIKGKVIAEEGDAVAMVKLPWSEGWEWRKGELVYGHNRVLTEQERAVQLCAAYPKR